MSQDESQPQPQPQPSKRINPTPLALSIHYLLTGRILSAIYLDKGTLRFDDSVHREFKRRVMVHKAQLRGMSKRAAESLVERFNQQGGVK